MKHLKVAPINEKLKLLKNINIKVIKIVYSNSKKKKKENGTIAEIGQNEC
jgi:hypothetical protein